MAELGRDEKTLEKIGSQDLTPNEVNFINFIVCIKTSIYYYRQEQL